MSRPKGIPLRRVNISVPASTMARVDALRSTYRLNASEVCSKALEAEAARLEAIK